MQINTPENSKTIWKFPEKFDIPDHFRKAIHQPEFVLQALWQRGINTPEKALRFLDWRAYSPAPSSELPDLEKGVQRVLDAQSRGETIGVWGDFDVDGQTATTVLIHTLRQLNLPCRYHIPLRAIESHGIKQEPLKKFLGSGIDLLLTCDTGISEYESIDYAQSQGVDVIVTDHHFLPENPPPALAVINPHFLDETHPLSPLAGVGVAYKFAEELLSSANKPDSISDLYDLVALGTIADLASLREENRYLVQAGIECIRRTPRPSLKSLFEFSGVPTLQVNENQLSFLIAPKLNALGRLEDANPIVEYLLSTDQAYIEKMTFQLETINSERKILCDQVFNGAISLLEKDKSLLDDPAIILVHPEWPAGVVGIIASRIVEIFHKPTLILVKNNAGILKGSARSIDGVDISVALKHCEEFLVNYGGHSMAAGLAVAEENFSLFKNAFQRTIRTMLETNKISRELNIEFCTSPAEISLEDAKALDALAPFGPGNPPILLCAQKVSLVSTLPIGKTGEHLKLTVEDENANQSTLLWWNGNGMPKPDGYFDLVYSVHATTYKGMDQLQLEWVDFREHSEQIKTKSGITWKKINVIDLRKNSNAESIIRDQFKLTDTRIWKEGTDEGSVIGTSRLHVTPCHTLVVWTAPVDIDTLKAVIQQTKPSEIVWVLRPPIEREPAVFLRSIWRFISSQQGDKTTINLADLISKLACSHEQIQLGLDWLKSTGKIRLLKTNEKEVTLTFAGTRDEQQMKSIEQSLIRSLAETNAYTEFLQNADLEKLQKELG